MGEKTSPFIRRIILFIVFPTYRDSVLSEGPVNSNVSSFTFNFEVFPTSIMKVDSKIFVHDSQDGTTLIGILVFPIFVRSKLIGTVVPTKTLPKF